LSRQCLMIKVTNEIFWRLFTLYLAGALLLSGIASAILAYLAVRYRAASPQDIPPDAPRPGFMPSAFIRTPSWSKLMLVSTGIIVTALTLYSFIPPRLSKPDPHSTGWGLDGGGNALVV